MATVRREHNDQRLYLILKALGNPVRLQIDVTPPPNDSARTEVRKGMLWTPLPGDDDDDQDDAAPQTAGAAVVFPIPPLVICRELRP